MHFLRFPFACLRDVTNFTARKTCVISVFTLRTWVPCFSAAQTLRGVFNVATRGIELASLAITLTTLGRLKTSTINRNVMFSGKQTSARKMADELKNCINQRAHGFYSNRIHTADSV